MVCKFAKNYVLDLRSNVQFNKSVPPTAPTKNFCVSKILGCYMQSTYFTFCKQASHVSVSILVDY